MLRPITRSVVSPGVRAVNSPIGNAWYSDPVMTVALTTSVGGTSYIYFNADSSTNPDNCLKVKVVQSTGEIALARRVGGSDTSLISVISTLTTPDNITIVVEKASDYASSQVSLFHNGVQKGLTQTINSAGIINNKIHYLSGDYGSSLLKKRRFALGSELAPNYSCDSTTDILAADCTISSIGGECLVDSGANSYFRVNENVTVTAGSVYEFSWYARKGTLSVLKYSIYGLPMLGDIIDVTAYNDGYNSVRFTAPVGCTSVWVYPIRNPGVAGTCYFDNVSVREVILP